MGALGALEMAVGSLLPGRPGAREIEYTKTLSLPWRALLGHHAEPKDSGWSSACRRAWMLPVRRGKGSGSEVGVGRLGRECLWVQAVVRTASKSPSSCFITSWPWLFIPFAGYPLWLLLDPVSCLPGLDPVLTFRSSTLFTWLPGLPLSVGIVSVLVASLLPRDRSAKGKWDPSIPFLKVDVSKNPSSSLKSFGHREKVPPL